MCMFTLITSLALTGCSSDTESGTSSATTFENIVYVNVNATGDNDGSSWENAFVDLQEALSNAVDGDNIWVAQGTYYPSEDDTSVSFVMLDNVDIYGGFDGTEVDFSERDYENNVTVLSGDLGVEGDNSDNTQKIVIAANSIIDGFTITAGNTMSQSGDIDPMSLGEIPEGEIPEGEIPEGVIVEGEVPEGEIPEGVIVEGEFPDDVALESSEESSAGHLTPDSITSGTAESSGNGAGIIIWNKAPTIQNCIITDNNSGKGGGVYIMGESDDGNISTFINTTFSNNTATGRGGAVSIDLGAEAAFIDCIFDGNDCTSGKGGAIYNDFGCSPLIENCLFVNNTAESGAAMANDGASCPIISNTTIVNNVALEEGGGLYQGSGPYNDPVVINSIIWGNESEQGCESIYNWNECFTYVSYSIVENGCVGDNILDVDPMFTDTEVYSIDESSEAMTASDSGEQIGFDATLIGTRTDEDYAEIISYLESQEKTYVEEAIDLSNPLLDYDTSNVGEVVYVSLDATGDNDGSSWENAFTDLSTAMDVANAAYENTGESVDVWVASGTYYTGDSRDDSFYLREGVYVYGGFTVGDTDMSNRDYTSTILSGEIGDETTKEDNSYHVVIGADNTILDGFVITGGYADGTDGTTYDSNGGGLLAYEGGIRCIPTYDYTIGFDMEISNCTFYDNYALSGGAVYAYHGANLEFTNCDFIENSANYGGAVIDVGGTNSVYNECNFEDNVAIYKGGAVITDYGAMSTFYDTIFTNNQAGTVGGAIYVIDRASQEIYNETDFYLINENASSLTDIYACVYLSGCEFDQNSAGSSGGAIYVYEGSYLRVVDSTFTNNKAMDNQIVIKNAAHIYADESLADSITLYDTSNAVYQ